MHAVSANCTSRTKGFPARRRDRRPRRPMHVKAYPNGKDRHIRSLYEFADPFFLFIPNAAGRGQAAAPTAKTVVRCEYPWRRQNPTRRRRDPSSVSAPQDDAPSSSGLRAARNHLPRRGRQGRPTVLPPAGEAPAKRVMRENVGLQQAVETEETGGDLPHLSAALTSSPAGGRTGSCGEFATWYGFAVRFSFTDLFPPGGDKPPPLRRNLRSRRRADHWSAAPSLPGHRAVLKTGGRAMLVPTPAPSIA